MLTIVDRVWRKNQHHHQTRSLPNLRLRSQENLIRSRIRPRRHRMRIDHSSIQSRRIKIYRAC